jgi:flagellar hook-associated protein 3 FlgL
MSNRVADSTNRSSLAERINIQRSRMSILQERITTGKRINRPSDDPAGAAAVIKLRTSQTEIEQFKRSTASANQRLTSADDAISSYQEVLDRVHVLVTQGKSDTTPQEAKNALATEIDALRGRILTIANSKYNDEYLFGGSRQTSPPFDPTTEAPNATPALVQRIQIEPGANAIAVGVTAETVFSDATATIFEDLTNAAAALRGTGDPVADKATLNATMSRLTVYGDMVEVAQAQIGANMKVTEVAADRLGEDFLSFEERIGSIEGDDFAASAVEYAEAKSALEATLEVSAASGRKTLFDYI